MSSDGHICSDAQQLCAWYRMLREQLSEFDRQVQAGALWSGCTVSVAAAD